MTVIRVVPISQQHTTPDEKFMAPRRRSESSENAAFLYKFEATQSLPVIDLRRTLSYRWLGPQRNLQFLLWMKKNFEFLHVAQVLGMLLTLAVIATPREIGQVLGPLAACLSMMSVGSTMVTASLDVLRLLTRHYEFWFFSVANLVTWALLGFFLEDVLRVISLVPLWLNLQLAISMDTNFRTFVIAVRSNVLVLVAIMVVGALVFLQVIDADQTRIEMEIPVPYARDDITLSLLGLFENALATLISFIMRVLFTKRKLFAARSAGSKLVRCQLYRAQLVLRPLRYSQTAGLGVEIGNNRTHVLHKQLGISAPEMSATSGNDTAQYHQQITLVALRLSTIDTRNLVLSSFLLQNSNGLSIFRRAGIYATGLAGLALTVVTLAFEPGGGESSTVHVIPVAGFLFTMVFCTVFACVSQRDMLRALLFHNFGFLFSMVHCSMASLCVADMMSWDYRCWAVASTFVWFVWVQLLDAVTPPVRRILTFSKLHVVPVLLLLLVLMIVVAYATVFLPIDRTGLRGRDLLYLHVGHNVIVLDTKSILLNRLFIMFLWTQRHAWNVFRGAFMHCWQLIYPPIAPETPSEEATDSEEEELASMRGLLEYFCPFETFPGIKRRIPVAPISSVNSIRRNSLTGRHSVRRISSAILLSGVVASSPEQQRQTRRRAFGQRSYPSYSENDDHTSPPGFEKAKQEPDCVPGTIPDE